MSTTELKIDKNSKNLKQILGKGQSRELFTTAFKNVDTCDKEEAKYNIEIINEIANTVYNNNKYITKENLALEVISILNASGFNVKESENKTIQGIITYLIQHGRIKKHGKFRKIFKKVLSVLTFFIL